VITELTYITSHPAKAERLGWYLSFPVTHQKLDLPEIQSLDPAEVATVKATEAYKQLRKPVLVEDVSIVFEAMGKLPGPLIKWFLSELKVEGLCRLLDGFPTRRASVEVTFALHDGKKVHIFAGKRTGTITDKPRGKELFGTDSIFIPDGWDKTWGEMTEEEEKASSVRRLALEKLTEFLKTA